MEELFYSVEMSAKEKNIVLKAIEKSKENDKISPTLSNISHYLDIGMLDLVLTKNEMSALMLALDNLIRIAYDDKNSWLEMAAVYTYNAFNEVYFYEKAHENFQDKKRDLRLIGKTSGRGT